MIPQGKLESKVGELLETLYSKRFAALEKLTLKTLLSKNPYLYRALGAGKASDLIDQLLIARVSSSDETIFGNDFFEPLAIFAAKQAVGSNGQGTVTVGAGAGQDIAIETASEYLAISVKSGINILNSQSAKGQSAEFQQLQARLKKVQKLFRPIIGYGYGRKKASANGKTVERIAGARFWELLSGEADFYLRIARAMEPFADTHYVHFKQALEIKHNALVAEFSREFVATDGRIDWDHVVQFNSSAEPPPRLTKASSRNRKGAIK